jgi:hypothetical protein
LLGGAWVLRSLRILFLLGAAAWWAEASTIAVDCGDARLKAGATVIEDATVDADAAGGAGFLEIRPVDDAFSASAFGPLSVPSYGPARSAVRGPSIRLELTVFGGHAPAMDGGHSMLLDGAAAPVRLLDLLAALKKDGVSDGGIQTYILESSFFPLLAEGLVEVNGTRLGEGGGAGRVRDDYLSLAVIADAVAAVPEPATFSLLVAGLGGLQWRRRRRAE